MTTSGWSLMPGARLMAKKATGLSRQKVHPGLRKDGKLRVTKSQAGVGPGKVKE